jgi:hypothetical protein
MGRAITADTIHATDTGCLWRASSALSCEVALLVTTIANRVAFAVRWNRFYVGWPISLAYEGP